MSLLHAELGMFTGSQTIYKHQFAANLPPSRCQSVHGVLKIMYSEGVQYLTEEGKCRWLLDAIVSHMAVPMKDEQCATLHFWYLIKGEKNTATLLCVRDSDEESMSKPLVKQEITYTDFPFPEDGKFHLYAGFSVMTNDVNIVNIFLPSEY